jgi:DNA polymerase-1
MITKEKKPKKVKEPKQLPLPESWGVYKYNVPLLVNPNPKTFSPGISLDVEDDEKGGFVGLGIYDGEACYYWSDWELAKQLTLPPFVAHNGKSDLRKLQAWGFNVDESWLLWDTQLMQHVLDSSQHEYGLKRVVLRDLGITYPSYDEIVGKHKAKCQRKECSCERKTLDKQDLGLVSNYNAMDTFVTAKLSERQNENPYDGAIDYMNTVEIPASFVFGRMEERGIRIDVPYLQQLNTSLTAKHEIIKKAILDVLGDINLNSPKQLLEALHAKSIQPVGVTGKLRNKPSTDKRALARFRDIPVIRDLLIYSELDTLISNFVIPYLSRNAEVVHPNFNQCGTRTGRPSCSNPNLLQIPRRTENGKLVRRMFVPREGMVFGDCDFGQIEPRVLAHLSKDKSLCELFTKDIDFHTYTAERLAIDREKAKILNLSVSYRATKYSVSEQLRCSHDTAQREIDAWWNLFPHLWDWQEKLIYTSRRDGYFTTLLGRRIKVDGLDHGNRARRESAERQLMNNIAQASAGEVMKMGMIKADQAGIKLLVQVYDELLLEETEAEIEAAMNVAVESLETAIKLDVPLVVDAKIGPNWAEVH